jgi:hypothetical protein
MSRRAKVSAVVHAARNVCREWAGRGLAEHVGRLERALAALDEHDRASRRPAQMDDSGPPLNEAELRAARQLGVADD